jgi:hypothetical protein
MNFKKLLIGFAACACSAATQAKQPDATQGRAPGGLYFLENKGQIHDQNDSPRPDIQFGLNGGDMNIFVGDGQLHYQFTRLVNSDEIRAYDEKQRKLTTIAEKDANKIPKPEYDVYRVDMELLGADKNARVVKESQIDYFERHYTMGSNGDIVYGFEKVTYQNVYPNIDWVIYSKDGVIEYDFVIRPGGNPGNIRMKYSGASVLRVEANGSLFISTPMGEIKQKAPYSFQADGKAVKSSFNLEQDVLSFSVASYEGVLTIDPTVDWGTYYGSSSSHEYGWGTASSPTSMGYIGGYTTGSSNLATSGAHQTSIYGGYDAFLAKFSPSGTRLWGTYFGGNSEEYEGRVAVDASGNVYLAGQTYSSVNIYSGGHQSSIGYGSCCNYPDAYLVKFDSTGVRQWSTYYGGTWSDYSTGLALDGSGNVYMGGSTNSNNNIYSSGHQSSVNNNGNSNSYEDGFLVKFNSSGVRQWGTYYGGQYTDVGRAVTCDPSGNVYLAGYTYSYNNIATSGAHQTSFYSNCANCYGDAYLVKFNSSGSRQWATYYGGASYSYYETADALACDLNGNVYIAGYVNSPQNNSTITTSGAFQTNAQSNNNEAYIAKFNPSGTRLWGSYYGGSGDDYARALVCDQFNNVYLSGETYNSSSGIASSTGAIQSSYGGNADAFIVKFDSTGVNRRWGTYYGGSCDDYSGYQLGIDTARSVLYFVGRTTSSNNIATTNGHQTSISGGSCNYLDAFLVRINDCPIPAQPGTISGLSTVCSGTSQTYSVTAVTGATSYTWTLPTGWTGTSTTNSITVTAGTTGGNITVTANVACGSSTAQTKAVTVNPSATATATAAGVTTFCQGNSVTINANTGTGLSYQWKLNGTDIAGQTNSSYTATASGSYTVVVTNSGGCSATSTAVAVTVNPLPTSTITAGGPTVICQGQNVMFTANSGTGLSYNWQMNGSSTGSTGATYTATTTGSYTLVVTNSNNCSTTSSPVAVTAHALPTAAVSVSGADPICAGGTSSVTIAGTPDAIVGYNIDGGNTQFIALDGSGNASLNTSILNANTTYNVIDAVSIEGCYQAMSSSDIINVNQRPTAAISGSPAVCAGNSGSLTVNFTGAGPWDFDYSDGTNTTSVSTSANPYTLSVSPGTTTSYTIATLSDANCSALGIDMSGTGTVTINTPATITSQPVGLTGCSGASAVLNVGATGTGLTYQWRYNGNAISNNSTYSGVTTASLTINEIGGVAGNYDVVINSACGSAVTSSAATIVENTGNQWTGAVNSLWSVPANWSCGTLPTANTNVTIPYTAVNMPEIDIPTAICNNLSIDYGATVVFINSGNMLEVKSDITANGIFDGSLGSVILSGSGTQQIPGATYREIRVLGGSDKMLTGDATVTMDLELQNGFLVLGSNDLTLAATSAVTGGSNASYVVTNSTGVVIGENMGLGGNTSAVLFPIGIGGSEYSPVRITNIGAVDNISARVIDNIYSNYNGHTPVGSALTANAVDRTWLISEGTPGGSNAIVTPYWDQWTEMGGFNRNDCYVSHYNTTSNSWEPGQSSVANGLNPYSQSMTVTSFSPFGVGSASSPLALDLLSFNGRKVENDAALSWATVNEFFVKAYDVERSVDGAEFEKIGSVAATGNGKAGENRYSYVDPAISNLAEKVFYRLKMNDQNGKFKYSNIIVLKNEKNAASANYTITYPNPVNGSEIFVKNADLLDKNMEIAVVDVAGRIINTVTVNAGQYTDMIPVNVANLVPGVYTIHIKAGSISEAIKFTKQ